MSVGQLALAAVAVAVGACLQGSVGFGFGTFAAPLLALVDRELVPGPLLMLAMLITALVAFRERADLDLGEVKWALVGRVPGTAVGAAAVAALPERTLTVVIALLVLLAVGVSVSGWRVRRGTASLLLAGAVSGVMGTATSIGGPPLALVYQHAPGARLRSSLAGFFLIGAAVSLVGLALFGEFGRREAAAGLLLVPPMLAGFAVSSAAARVLDRGRTRSAVLAVSGASAAFLLARQLL